MFIPIGNHAINSLLKSLATQTTVLIEPEGLNLYRVNSYMNLVINEFKGAIEMRRNE